MPTIRDIATKAGVAVSTASLALNGDGRVRPTTRERVLEAARALEYHPMRAARVLSTGRTYAFHILNPTVDAALSTGFFTRFVRGVHDLAKEHRYSVALSILDDEVEAGVVLERLVLERWADGVILMNPSENEALLAKLSKRRFPHVVLGRGAREDVPSVDNDNVQVACDAAAHLLERHGGPVLLLNGPKHHTFTRDRECGFSKAHAATGAPVDDRLIRFIPGTAERAGREVARLLREGPRFRSILAVNDAQAVGAMHALASEGLRIPDDVAVVGMNNDDIAAYTSPRLTSVELSAQELGRQAATLLLNCLETGRIVAERRLVPHRLVLRESS